MTVIVSPGEADSVCALLVLWGFAHCAMSLDNDYILGYRLPWSLIADPKSTLTFRSVRFETDIVENADLRAAMGIPPEWDGDDISSACVGAGCDYFSDGVHGVGQKRCFKLYAAARARFPGHDQLSERRGEYARLLHELDQTKVPDMRHNCVVDALHCIYRLFDDPIGALPRSCLYEQVLNDGGTEQLRSRLRRNLETEQIRMWPADGASADLVLVGAYDLLPVPASGSCAGCPGTSAMGAAAPDGVCSCCADAPDSTGSRHLQMDQHRQSLLLWGVVCGDLAPGTYEPRALPQLPAELGAEVCVLPTLNLEDATRAWEAVKAGRPSPYGAEMLVAWITRTTNKAVTPSIRDSVEELLRNVCMVLDFLRQDPGHFGCPLARHDAFALWLADRFSLRHVRDATKGDDAHAVLKALLPPFEDGELLNSYYPLSYRNISDRAVSSIKGFRVRIDSGMRVSEMMLTVRADDGADPEEQVALPAVSIGMVGGASQTTQGEYVCTVTFCAPFSRFPKGKVVHEGCE